MAVDQSLYDTSFSVSSTPSTGVREYVITQPSAPSEETSPDPTSMPTPVMKPGAATINTPTGDVHRIIPGTEYVYRANYVLTNTALLISNQQRLIADLLNQEKLISYQKNNNQAGAVSFVRLDDPLFNPAAGRDKEYLQALDEQRLLSLFVLGDKIEAYKEADKEVKRNVNEVSENSKFGLDSILDIIIEEGLDWLVDQVNELLPPGYDLELSVEDGEIQSVGIGGVRYNLEDNSLSYNLKRYSGYIGKVIGLINDFLPDFLDLGFTGTSITFMGVEIKFGDLLEGEFKPIFGNISIGRLGGEIKISAGGKEMSIFNIDFEVLGDALAIGALSAAGKYVSNKLRPGIGSLNREIQQATGISNFVDVSFNAKGRPNFKLGPFSYDSSTGEVNISGGYLRNTVGGALQRKIFNKLPGPLGNIANRIWRSIPFDDIVNDLFKAPGIEDKPPKPPEPPNTINVDIAGLPSNPRVSSSPVGTYTPSEVATATYDINNDTDYSARDPETVSDFSGGYSLA